MLKSISNQLNSEQIGSIEIHKMGVPLLVSGLVMRSMNCGQIDIGLWLKGSIILYEIKSSLRISISQIRRLKGSASFLSLAFRVPVEIKLRVYSRGAFDSEHCIG